MVKARHLLPVNNYRAQLLTGASGIMYLAVLFHRETLNAYFLAYICAIILKRFF